MKISFNTPIVPERLTTVNGYGYATERMLASLDNLGYEVTVNDPTADVGLCFNQPHHWKFYGNQYKIGYHPWESTQLMPGWAGIMNECDEIWTPSPLIANWYADQAGVTKPVYVYEHGVDKVWKPKERVVDGPFRFLHTGGEALRKGAVDVLKARRMAFPNNRDVRITMKVMSDGWNLGILPNVDVINKKLSLEELIELFHSHHAYAYPSYGEGFGLTPLQAMATGMPTITVGNWAPYRAFLIPELEVSGRIVKSPWPAHHPGHMLKPNMDELIESMRYTYENYEEVQREAHALTDKIFARYDWDSLTDRAFAGLEKRLENL